MKVDANIRNPGTLFLYFFLVQSLDLNTNFKSDFFFQQIHCQEKENRLDG